MPVVMKIARGYSLLELMLVIATLAIIAAIALPNFAVGDQRRVDVAAEAFADAMRFARSESMRSGTRHGFRGLANNRIRVVELDMTSSPPGVVGTINHPVTKQKYIVDIETYPFADVDSVTTAESFRGVCVTQRQIWFDEFGTPWCRDPETVLLLQFDVTLTRGSTSRVVRLDGITGRVSVL